MSHATVTFLATIFNKVQQNNTHIKSFLKHLEWLQAIWGSLRILPHDLCLYISAILYWNSTGSHIRWDKLCIQWKYTLHAWDIYHIHVTRICPVQCVSYSMLEYHVRVSDFIYLTLRWLYYFRVNSPLLTHLSNSKWHAFHLNSSHRSSSLSY